MESVKTERKQWLKESLRLHAAPFAITIDATDRKVSAMQLSGPSINYGRDSTSMSLRNMAHVDALIDLLTQLKAELAEYDV